MNAPKRVWIPNPDYDTPWYPQKPEGESVEYTRSDLIPRWVSVKEEEPEDTEDFCDEFVVLFDIVDGGGTGYLGTAEFVEGEWFPPASSQRVTHWLKGVPPIPKEE